MRPTSVLSHLHIAVCLLLLLSKLFEQVVALLCLLFNECRHGIKCALIVQKEALIKTQAHSPIAYYTTMLAKHGRQCVLSPGTLLLCSVLLL